MTPGGPYAAMHTGAARAYPQMSPAATPARDVAAAIVEELERPSPRFRLRVGEDAERMVGAVRRGDAEFEFFLRHDIGFRWAADGDLEEIVR
jgi:hypothetical protein